MSLRDQLSPNMQLQIKIVEDPQWGADEIERLEELVESCSARNEADAALIKQLEAKIGKSVYL